MDSDLKTSANEIKYHDLNNLRFCNFFHTIIEPPLTICNACINCRDVLELQGKKCKMWVDSTGKLNEKDTGKNSPVMAEIVIANVKGKFGELDKQIILNNFPAGVSWCPFC